MIIHSRFSHFLPHEDPLCAEYLMNSAYMIDLFVLQPATASFIITTKILAVRVKKMINVRTN